MMLYSSFSTTLKWISSFTMSSVKVMLLPLNFQLTCNLDSYTEAFSIAFSNNLDHLQRPTHSIFITMN
jgi:hypothetical protein